MILALLPGTSFLVPGWYEPFRWDEGSDRVMVVEDVGEKRERPQA